MPIVIFVKLMGISSKAVPNFIFVSHPIFQPKTNLSSLQEKTNEKL